MITLGRLSWSGLSSQCCSNSDRRGQRAGYPLQGRLTMQLRDRAIHLEPGELFVVPKGVEHRPVAAEEVHLLLIEPVGTPNTGDIETTAARQVL